MINNFKILWKRIFINLIDQIVIQYCFFLFKVKDPT